MDHTDRRKEERARGGETSTVDFDRLRTCTATIQECGSARSVREELAHVVLEELGPDAVGVYQQEGDRYRATVRTPATDSISLPGVLPAECSLTAIVDEGNTRCGTLSEDSFGDATAYCITSLNGDGAVLILSADHGGFGPGVRAGFSMLVGFAEGTLADVEGGTLRRAATTETRPDVSEAELLDALSHAFPDNAFIFDEDGTFLDVLLGIRTIQMHAHEQLVGQTVHDVYNDDHADRIISTIQAAIGTGEVQQVEYATDGPDRRTHYEATVAPLRNDGDERGGVVLVARDVSERYVRERDLRRQNERLEEFASIVSHDLRNPLNTASGYLELVSADVDDDRLDRVSAAHDRMESLIDDLLTLARDGQTVGNAGPVDLQTATEQAWRTVSIDGTLEVTGTVTLRADSNQFRQVLENLLRNVADHATPDPTVSVGILSDGEGFYVADDGEGIPLEEREHVFETGYTSVSGGTGLGLAIVERVADAHGWDVVASEAATGGARFEFRNVEIVE